MNELKNLYYWNKKSLSKKYESSTNMDVTIWMKLIDFKSPFLAGDLKLLRSEISSGMCAKLRTVAASNNRVHMPWSLYYCLFAPHICTVLFFRHIPFVANHTINAAPPERLQQNHVDKCTQNTGRIFWIYIGIQGIRQVHTWYPGPRKFKYIWSVFL